METSDKGPPANGHLERRYPRLPLSRRAMFQTSPQRPHRQYVSASTFLLAVTTLAEWQVGQRGGDSSNLAVSIRTPGAAQRARPCRFDSGLEASGGAPDKRQTLRKAGP